MKKRKILIIIVYIVLSLTVLSSCKEKQDTPEEEKEETVVETIDISGKQMEYFRFGNREGRKLIILPGLSLKSVMGSAGAVALAYSDLGSDYDIYLLDHIKEEPEDYSVEDMAEDTYSVLKKIGLDKFSIMGVSLGGMITETISLKHPESVESLVLCSTTSRVKEENKELFETWKKLAEEKI